MSTFYGASHNEHYEKDIENTPKHQVVMFFAIFFIAVLAVYYAFEEEYMKMVIVVLADVVYACLVGGYIFWDNLKHRTAGKCILGGFAIAALIAEIFVVIGMNADDMESFFKTLGIVLGFFFFPILGLAMIIGGKRYAKKQGNCSLQVTAVCEQVGGSSAEPSEPVIVSEFYNGGTQTPAGEYIVRYQANGQEFTLPAQACFAPDDHNYFAGRELTLYVDPDDPKKYVRNPNYGGADLVVVMGYGFLILGIITDIIAYVLILG